MVLAIPLMWPHNECNLKTEENNGICFFWKIETHSVKCSCTVLLQQRWAEPSVGLPRGASDQVGVDPLFARGSGPPGCLLEPCGGLPGLQGGVPSPPQISTSGLHLWTPAFPDGSAEPRAAGPAALPSQAQVFPTHRWKRVSTNVVLRLNV